MIQHVDLYSCVDHGRRMLAFAWCCARRPGIWAMKDKTTPITTPADAAEMFAKSSCDSLFPYILLHCCHLSVVTVGGKGSLIEGGE